MKLRFILLALLGLGLAVYLVFYVGFAAVFSAALEVGWGGFAILIAYALALFVVLAGSWQVLVPGAGITIFLWGRMVRDSAAEVLPFSQVGGFVIGARAANLKGLPAPMAFASTIVDVTTEMMAQIVYVALGIALLAERAPQNSFTATLTATLTIGLAAATIIGIAFLFVQRRGSWITAKFASHILPTKLAHAATLTTALDAIYRSPVRVGVSLVLHLVGWIASAIGTWIAFRLIGADVDLAAVVAIESLVYAMRSAAFIVPNALGVQEGAYAMLAPLLGVGPELGLAVSLLKRARDIAIGVPILLLWQAMEGKRALAPKAGGELS
ncbi:MAG: HpnL family protein [Alphaproteobacteria bacterium]|nr:HpnL family protein [Alphaproteobacteria bacterium]